MKRSFSTLPAFSLIEITLALGIVAFVLTAILGLFPVAMKHAFDSQAETRAVFIAQRIFSDLRAGPSEPTRIGLQTNGTYSVQYSETGEPDAEHPLDEAHIWVTPHPVLTTLSRVEVQVETLADRRTKFNFVTLMSNRAE